MSGVWGRRPLVQGVISSFFGFVDLCGYLYRKQCGEKRHVGEGVRLGARQEVSVMSGALPSVAVVFTNWGMAN
jgi:hypothetical protein